MLKEFKIKNVKISGPLVLGPMAGVSCNAFFRLAEDMGANLIYGGMIDVDKVDVLSWERIKEIYLDFDNSKIPFVAQIVGGIKSKEKIKKLIKFLDEQKNVDIIDLNVGCPLIEQIKKGAGSALLNEKKDLIEILKIMKSNTQKPITIKLRPGFEEENLFDFIDEILPFVDGICIHPRLQKLKYGGRANHEISKKLVEFININIPTIISGDILKPGSAKFILESTKASGIMFARGVVGNPYLIKRTKQLIETGKNPEELTWKIQKNIIIKFMEYYSLQKNKPIGLFIQHIKWFLKSFFKNKEAKEIEKIVNSEKNSTDLNDLIVKLKTKLL